MLLIIQKGSNNTLGVYLVGTPIFIIRRNDTPPVKNQTNKNPQNKNKTQNKKAKQNQQTQPPKPPPPHCGSLRLTFESFHGLLKMVLKIIFCNFCSTFLPFIGFVIIHDRLIMEIIGGGRVCLVGVWFGFSAIDASIEEDKNILMFFENSVCSVCNDIKNRVAA